MNFIDWKNKLKKEAQLNLRNFSDKARHEYLKSTQPWFGYYEQGMSTRQALRADLGF